MGEWTRLTPDDMPLHHAVIEYKHRPEVVEFPHIFRCDDNTMHFADAELLALTQVSSVYRQLPEVRALVEAGELVYHEQWAHDAHGFLVDANYDLSEQFANFMHDLHAAMEPFVEEPADA